MKLLVHNMLASNVKGITEKYPLELAATNVIHLARSPHLSSDTMQDASSNSNSTKKEEDNMNDSESESESESEMIEVEYNETFIVNLLKRVNYPVLKAAANAIGYNALPDSPPEDATANDSQFLKLAHHALMNIEIMEGELKCKESGRVFPIHNGIPNMLLNEDEV